MYVCISKRFKSVQYILWKSLFAIVDPYFFEDKADQAITGKGEQYRLMIIDFFGPAIFSNENAFDNISYTHLLT